MTKPTLTSLLRSIATAGPVLVYGQREFLAVLIRTGLIRTTAQRVAVVVRGRVEHQPTYALTAEGRDFLADQDHPVQ